jgi:hypothetical protein
MMATPNSWSKLAVGITLASGDTGDEVAEELPGEVVANCNEALSSATPPPGKIPSSTAARLACNASSNFNFRRSSYFDDSHSSTQLG